MKSFCMTLYNNNLSNDRYKTFAVSLVQLSLTSGPCEETVIHWQCKEAVTGEPRHAGWGTNGRISVVNRL